MLTVIPQTLYSHQRSMVTLTLCYGEAALKCQKDEWSKTRDNLGRKPAAGCNMFKAMAELHFPVGQQP